MPKERLSMRKIKEVLRLKAGGWSDRQIAKSCVIARSTVADYLKRAKAAGLAWSLPEEMGQEELEQLLFPSASTTNSGQLFLPDWSTICMELKKKHVTLALLWQEYKEQHPGDGYQYSHFCDLYRAWKKRLNLVMRQEHRAGEKLFVDYCGRTIPVVDGTTGNISNAEIFVAVLGASNFTYVDATRTQTLPDWIGSHERALHFFGGVPELVVPDNLRSGVSRACRYDPDINPTYQEFAVHYGIAVMPARARRPKDKSKVEVGVQLVERWIHAKLRNRTFFSLADLNEAIRPLLDQINQKPFKKLPGSRRLLFETLDKPALKPLPDQLFPVGQWIKVRVGMDYHCDVDGHYYSVPHLLVGLEMEVRLTERTVECFHKGHRVASHCRSHVKGGKTTVAGHMPDAHRLYLESQSPDYVLELANQIGISTRQMAKVVLEKQRHPQQGVRACLGILRLGDQFGKDRLEAACARALAIGATSFRSIQSILRHGLEKLPLSCQEETSTPNIRHDNIRGPHYYH